MQCFSVARSNREEHEMNPTDAAMLTGNKEKIRHRIRRAFKFGPRQNRGLRKWKREMKSMLS